MRDFGTRPSLPRLISRACILRCPRCGASSILRTWFKLRHSCPYCGLVFERGEPEDYWLGAYMLNLVAAELAAAALILGFILATRPNVNWELVQYGAVAAAVIMPILFFPFSRTLWLAVDLYVRPAVSGDRLDSDGQPD